MYADDDPANVATSRLLLTAVTMAELDHIAALHADERVWRHRPEGRHTSVEQTRGKVDHFLRQWAADGLGYWTARLREPVADLPAGAFAGVGGCAVPEGAIPQEAGASHQGWWNLYYRFRPESQGRGLASELCQAALAAAHSVNAERPVVAHLLEANQASKATAERAGLALQWRGPDSDYPDEVRLIYADRDLDTDLLTAVLGHHP